MGKQGKRAFAITDVDKYIEGFRAENQRQQEHKLPMGKGPMVRLHSALSAAKPERIRTPVNRETIHNYHKNDVGDPAIPNRPREVDIFTATQAYE